VWCQKKHRVDLAKRARVEERSFYRGQGGVNDKGDKKSSDRTASKLMDAEWSALFSEKSELKVVHHLCKHGFHECGGMQEHVQEEYSNLLYLCNSCI
jgi:hypothetical protein